MFSYLKNLFWRSQQPQSNNQDCLQERKRKYSSQNSESGRDEAKRCRASEKPAKENLVLSTADADFQFSKNVIASFRGTPGTVLICRTNSARSCGPGTQRRNRSLYESFFSGRRHLASVACCPDQAPTFRLSMAALSSTHLPSGGRQALQSTPLMSKSGSKVAASAAMPEVEKLSPIRTAHEQKQAAATDDDCVITSVEGPKSVAEIFAPCKYFAADWLQDIKTSSEALKSYRSRIETDEKLKAQYWAKKRAADEADLVARVQRNLQLAERQVPLVPYKFEEVPAAAEVEDEFPPLSEAQEQAVQRAWSRQLSGAEVLAEGFGIRVTRDDLRTLSGLSWLNDNVVNFYMQLLATRAAAAGCELPSVHAFSTFFFTKLCTGGQAAVRRWTRKVDIFDKCLLLCPVHLHNNHWTLCIVDLRYKAIHYFDSIASGGDPSCLPMLRQYLQDEHLDKKGAVLDTSCYQLVQHDAVPQQQNGSDCGVFCCKFADYYCKDKDFTFGQKHMPYFRKRIVAEIISKQLMW